LGIPVISVGVPTVVDTSTLIFDTLTSAGITELTEKMTDGLSSSENLFVTPKEADVIVESSAVLLSASINNALVISEK
jgi:spore protease